VTVLDHIGRWTMLVPEITRDELHYDVIAIAQQQGMRSTGPELARLATYRSALQDYTDTLGQATLPDPESGDLEAMARRAVDWLTANAPGRTFVLTDALYCWRTDDGPG
jgi:hypothetical protein